MRRVGGSGRGRISDGLARVGFHLVVWTLVAVVLLPFLWPLMVSLNNVTVGALLENGIGWWFRGADFRILLYALSNPEFGQALWNSVLVATATAVVGTAVAVAGAYGIERFEFTGRRLVSWFLLLLPMVPQTVIVIPLFLLFHRVGLFNSRLALVVAYVALTLPFTTWLLRPLVDAVPRSPEDAALIDGCTRLGAFLRVFLPAARPTVAAAFTFGWVLAYNELFFAVVLINDPAKRTLPIQFRYGVGPPGVAAVLATVPILVIFAVLWRLFLGGDLRRVSE